MEKKTENKEKKEKSEKSSFWTFRKIIAILLILCSIVVAILFGYLMPAEKTVLMERLNYSFQIVTNIFVICGGIIAVWQYYISSQSAKNDLKIQQVQRAIDLSEYYKDNILKYTTAIKYILNESGCGEIIKKISLDSMNDFTKEELETILSADDIKYLRESQYTTRFSNAVIEANLIHDLNFDIPLPPNYFDNEQNAVSPNKNAQKSFLDLLILARTSILFTDVMNNMEYFALHFTHKTADDSVVYQSLHQSYLEIVPYLYYFLARQNDSPTKKYYTNVIELFIKWRDESNKKESEEQEIMAKHKKDLNSLRRGGTIIDTEY